MRVCIVGARNIDIVVVVVVSVSLMRVAFVVIELWSHEYEAFGTKMRVHHIRR